MGEPRRPPNRLPELLNKKHLNTPEILHQSAILTSFRMPLSGAGSKMENIMKRPTKQKTIRRKANVVKGISVSDPEYLTPLIEPFDGVWSGQIARLRYYVSQQMVQVFLAPGNNNNLIGTTTDPTLIQALFLARDNGRAILGATGNNIIEFIDY
jgi:hypothetical protein